MALKEEPLDEEMIEQPDHEGDGETDIFASVWVKAEVDDEAEHSSETQDVVIRKARRRVTYTQLESLLKVLNQHRGIATGYNKTAQAREYMRRMWQRVASNLNLQKDGAEKDWKGWSKYWNDYKSKLKTRLAAARHYKEQTGGTPPEAQFTDQELKFLQILGEDIGAVLPGARVEPFNEPILEETSKANEARIDEQFYDVPLQNTEEPEKKSESKLLNMALTAPQRSVASTPASHSSPDAPAAPPALPPLSSAPSLLSSAPAIRRPLSSAPPPVSSAPTVPRPLSSAPAIRRPFSSAPRPLSSAPPVSRPLSASPVHRPPSAPTVHRPLSAPAIRRPLHSAPPAPRRRVRRREPIARDASLATLIAMTQQRAAEDRRRNELLEALVKEVRSIKEIINTRFPEPPSTEVLEPTDGSNIVPD